VLVEDLQELFQKYNVPFELINHKVPIHTAQEGATHFGITIGQTAPTLILKTDKGFFALIMSGDRGHVDLDEVASIVGCNKVKLAGAREVEKVTGCTVGSISMVGHNLPCIIDKRLFQYSYIYGGSGTATCTLKINPSALEKLNKIVATLEWTRSAKAEHRGFKWDSTPPEVYEEPTPTYRSGGLENLIKVINIIY
jgi:Cys-tRNA(Pro)/Cys-tRNA(Cys) deacylase